MRRPPWAPHISSLCEQKKAPTEGRPTNILIVSVLRSDSIALFAGRHPFMQSFKLKESTMTRILPPHCKQRFFERLNFCRLQIRTAVEHAMIKRRSRPQNLNSLRVYAAGCLFVYPNQIADRARVCSAFMQSFQYLEFTVPGVAMLAQVTFKVEHIDQRKIHIFTIALWDLSYL